jgi:hypothetical protein
MLLKVFMLEAQSAKRANQRHVVDDVDHFAVNGGSLVGEIIVQRLSGRREPEHGNHHAACDDDQDGGHLPAHGPDQGDGGDRGNTGRQHIPDEHVFEGKNRVRGRRDAAGQHSRQAIREVTGRMSGQVTKHVAPEIACDADKRKARNPAGNSPQEIVCRDQRYQQGERRPHAVCVGGAAGEAIDKRFHAILGAHRTGNRRNDRRQNAKM